MEVLTEILQDTPWWVYILFFYLVYFGFRATRPRTTNMHKLFLLPIIFTLCNLVWLYERIQGNAHLLVFWPIGLCIGAYLGWIMIRKWKVRHVKDLNSISLPPTWSTLILILLVFVVRYFFLFNYEIFPERASHLFLADSLISGTITGIFFGRSFRIYQKSVGPE